MPFWGLPNFAPPGVEAEGAYWPTVEHYFQAQKFESAEMREKVRRAQTPKEARSIGQSREHRIRSDWDEVREKVMLRALLLKFRHTDARALFLSTGDRALVEASPFDYFWACGQDGSGQNRLGHLLVKVREHMRTCLP